MSFFGEVVKSTSLFRILIKIDSTTYSGRFSFNDFTPIGSSVPYDGRLLSVPKISITRDSSFFGRLVYASSSFSLANTDGYFDTIIDDYDIIGATIRIFIGYENIDISEYINIYTGYLESLKTNKSSIVISITDIRKKLDTIINDFWLNQNALDVLKEVILASDSTVSYTSTYFDTVTWDSARALAPNITAFSTNTPLSGEQLAQNICTSLFGSLFITGDGRYSFLYIDESTSPILTISKDDIMNDDYDINYETIKILSKVVVNYDLADFLVSSISSLVVTDTSRDSYVFNKYKLHREQDYTTYLIGPTAASIYAKTVLDYYYEVHGEFSITVPIKYYTATIGSIITVEIYRNSQAILGTKNCEIMGVSYNLDNATITLDLRLAGTPSVVSQTTTASTVYQAVGGSYVSNVVSAAVASSSSALTSLLPRFRGVLFTDPITDNREGDTYYNGSTLTVMGFLTGAWITSSGTFTAAGVGADVAGAAASAYTNAVAAANLYTASVGTITRETMATKFGFSNWVTMSGVASAIGPILNAGYLNATVIDVQALFAQQIALLSSGSIYSGTGTYGTSTTGVYLDANGKFSLKDRLTWDGTTLSLVNGVFSGSITATSGSFVGSITATSGSIGGCAIDSTGIQSNDFNATSQTGWRLANTGGAQLPFISGNILMGYGTVINGVHIVNSDIINGIMFNPVDGITWAAKYNLDGSKTKGFVYGTFITYFAYASSLIGSDGPTLRITGLFGTTGVVGLRLASDGKIYVMDQVFGDYLVGENGSSVLLGTALSVLI